MPTSNSHSSDLSFYDSLLRAGASEPAKIRPSAAVVPWRLDESGEIEVWWVRRAPTMQFMGGFWAFPGGGLSRRDALVPVDGQPEGTSDSTYTRSSPELDETEIRALGPDLAPGTAAGALRELFEEAGVLAQLDDPPDPRVLVADRGALLRNETEFVDLVERHGPIDASQLVFAGRWLTPPFVPMRFDNRFFLLHWPDHRAGQPELPSFDGVRCEHDRGEWVKPKAALRRWRANKLLTAPPILHILRVLADENGPTESALERLRDTREANLGPLRKIEFLPGIVILPLRTPSLPPATHTNAFLLGFPGDDAVLIDPATSLPDEQEKLLQALDAAKEQGYRIHSIFLSHHHPDHVGAAEAVRKHLEQDDGIAFFYAHGCDAATLQRRGILLEDELADGQSVVFGEGDTALEIQVVHTPGHTRGHLSFFLPASRALLGSDLTSTLSTIVIDPPDGDMDQYLSSLRKAALLDAAILFPSHGPAHLFPTAHLEEVVEHRLEREEKVLAAWNAGLTSAADMVPEVYEDLAPMLYPVAERQIEAHLVRLRRDGYVPRD